MELVKLKFRHRNSFPLLNIFFILTKAFKLLDYHISDLHEFMFINQINNYRNIVDSNLMIEDDKFGEDLFSLSEKNRDMNNLLYLKGIRKLINQFYK